MIMSSKTQLKNALVTGANGYIGNAVARAFSRAGWITYGLVRSASSAQSLAAEEILPVIGSIDDISSHESIKHQLPAHIDVIVSVTEDLNDYVRHYNNIISLLRSITAAQSSLSESQGVNKAKPLVIFTSGCKDYGIGPHYATDPDLAPHTEESPINPPVFARLRAEYSQRIFEHHDAFSPVLVRPTNVHGRSSSFFGIFFVAAQKVTEAQAGGSKAPLTLVTPRPDTICHSLHVDDCADAYVAIASHPSRGEVEGQVFNISARRYETVDQIGRALVAEYGIAGGVEFVEDAAKLAPGQSNPWPPMLIDFPQWTGSDKLRRVTGWSDRRPLFSESVHVYRLAYEAMQEKGHENIQKVNQILQAFREIQDPVDDKIQD